MDDEKKTGQFSKWMLLIGGLIAIGFLAFVIYLRIANGGPFVADNDGQCRYVGRMLVCTSEEIERQGGE